MRLSCRDVEIEAKVARKFSLLPVAPLEGLSQAQHSQPAGDFRFPVFVVVVAAVADIGSFMRRSLTFVPSCRQPPYRTKL